MNAEQREDLRKAALRARERGELVVNETPQQTRRRTFDSPQERQEWLAKKNRERVQRHRARLSGV